MSSMSTQPTLLMAQRNEGENCRHLGKRPPLATRLRVEWIRAARKNDMRKIKHLLSNNQQVPIYWTNKNGLTAVHIAIEENNTNLLIYLLKKDTAAQVGAEDKEQRTPLHLAVSLGRTRIVKLLIEKFHLSVNLVNSQDVSLVYMAAAHGRYDTLTYLMQTGADVNHSTFSNDTPLHVAVRKNHHKIIKRLVEEGNVNVKARNATGDTALHDAVRSKNFIAVKYLIEECKASPLAENADGETPLYIAVYEKYEYIAEYMVRVCNMGWYHELVKRLINEISKDVQQEEEADDRHLKKEKKLIEKIKSKKQKSTVDRVANQQVERRIEFEKHLRNLNAMIQSRKRKERNDISSSEGKIINPLFSGQCSHAIEPQAGPSHAVD